MSSNVYSPRPDRNRAMLAHSRSTCRSPWHGKRLSTTDYEDRGFSAPLRHEADQSMSHEYSHEYAVLDQKSKKDSKVNETN